MLAALILFVLLAAAGAAGFYIGAYRQRRRTTEVVNMAAATVLKASNRLVQYREIEDVLTERVRVQRDQLERLAALTGPVRHPSATEREKAEWAEGIAKAVAEIRKGLYD